MRYRLHLLLIVLAHLPAVIGLFTGWYFVDIAAAKRRIRGMRPIPPATDSGHSRPNAGERPGITYDRIEQHEP
jgi:hypothetical protein